MESSNWNDQVCNVAVEMVNKVIAKVKEQDQIKQYWHVLMTKNGVVL